VAIERANRGDVSVDAVLAALRRAAEDDGIEDVDAVVAEFATFVRAQAPHLASQRLQHRPQGARWRTAAATVTIAAATVGALATGVVSNPFLGTTSIEASAASDVSDASEASDASDASTAGVRVDMSDTAPLTGGAASTNTPAADGVGVETIVDQPPVELAFSASMTFTDPDALAIAEQQVAGPVPTVPTVPTDTTPTTSNTPTTPTPTTPTPTTMLPTSPVAGHEQPYADTPIDTPIGLANTEPAPLEAPIEPLLDPEGS